MTSSDAVLKEISDSLKSQLDTQPSPWWHCQSVHCLAPIASWV